MNFLRKLLTLLVPQSPTNQEKLVPYSKRLVLEELRTVLTHQFEAGDALDSKLKQLLGNASLILSLVTTLQVATGIEYIGWPYWVSLGIVLFLYVALIVTILKGLQPIDYHAPIPSDWKEISERYFDLDEDKALDLLISNYLHYSKENKRSLDYKAKKVKIAACLFVLIIIALVVMGVLCLGLDTFSLTGAVSPLPTPTP